MFGGQREAATVTLVPAPCGRRNHRRHSAETAWRKWFGRKRGANMRTIPTTKSGKVDFRTILRRKFASGFVACAALAMVGTAAAQEPAAPLHVFTNGTDGGGPQAGLTADSAGSLFGTTWSGGDLSCGGGAGCGVIFEEIAPASASEPWTYSVLYDFTGGSDGCCQLTTPAFDHAGRLYGVTNNGLPGGSVFQLTPTATGKWKFALIHTFTDPTTFNTWTPLVFDKAGRIYAASYYGGLPGCNFDSGCGNVVQLTPIKGGAWTEETLYKFRGGSDGGNPSNTLIAGPHGVYYGSAAVGGLVRKNCTLGCGVIFQLTPPAGPGGSWTESVIYTFQGTPDGADPYSLTGGSEGALYGLACCQGSANSFNIFKLTPPAPGGSAWTKTVIHSFSQAQAAATYITVGANGVLYGTSFGEIDFAPGYVFQLTQPATRGGAWTFTNFGDPGPSRNPNGVTPGLFGVLYGTLNGGDSDAGAVFGLKP